MLPDIEGNTDILTEEMQVVEKEEVALLYEDLLTKVFHDDTTAKRLIQYEKKRTPTASLIEVLENAIARWIRDNH
ncbi:MAG: hypothetical protein HN392_01735 [Anaerolineae bacterium]|nr:hypothetical protein [Anaerolineae bacterium]MBT7075409.1 hypothetical protein [Anaerolineae bacterium]MBT7781427.1 hypothetical protein [Anaerolineae bacterium]